MAGTPSGSPNMNINKAGNTQPRPTGGNSKNPGGPGAVPAVAGGNSPIIVKTGAKNKGGR